MNKILSLILISIFALSAPAYGRWRQGLVPYDEYLDQTYLGGVPALGTGRIYVVGNDIFFIDDVGTATSMIAGAAGGDPDQNLWETVTGDTGSVIANSITDSLAILGGTNCDTVVGTDTVTINVTGGAGDVSKVGTPVNNQVGVWTGDGTIEGTTALTFDGTTLLNNNIEVVGTNTTFIGDVSGTIKANQVDSVQANSVTLATDTTGNYAATVADAGNSTITVANSGTENAAITLDLTANGVDDTHIDWGTGANQVSLDDVPEGVTTYYTNNAWNGTFKESFDADVTSDGATVTMSIEKSGTGDLTTQFSSGVLAYDTTPADTIALTAGSDASPQSNWIYILQSAPTVLVKSTSAWPSAEHIKIGFFFVQSAATVQSAGGPLVNQNWNDHLTDTTTNQGHITHVTEKVRRLGPTYFSGVTGNGATASYYTISASNTEFVSTSGVIEQLHMQTFPAFTTPTNTIHVVNSSVSAYRAITDLFSITTDSTGATITNNKYFNLTLWGVINKTGEHQVVMCNVPGGSYNSQVNAETDALGYDNFTIPREFSIDSSNGFLIARTTFQMGTTWTHVSTVDLRGITPQSASGGASGIATSFADNTFDVFDNTDVTKLMRFDVGTSVSTATTRTYVAPDANGTLALTSQSDGTIVSSSTSISGIVELATTTEIDAGTDSTRAMPVDQFEASDYGKRTTSLLLNGSTDLTTGDGKIYFRLPDELAGWSIINVQAARSTGTGTDTYMLRNVTQAADVLSTILTMDANELDSNTAAVPPVIDTAQDDGTLYDRYAIDVDSVGSSTKFCEVQVTFKRIP